MYGVPSRYRVLGNFVAARTPLDFGKWRHKSTSTLALNLLFVNSETRRRFKSKLAREIGDQRPKMLGRIRASPVDCSDLERPSPKITKNDALSIYEATLEKLRLGARRVMGSSSMKATKIEAPSSSLMASPSPSDVQSGDCCSVMSAEVPPSCEVQSIGCIENLMEEDSCSSLSSSVIKSDKVGEI